MTHTAHSCVLQLLLHAWPVLPFDGFVLTCMTFSPHGLGFFSLLFPFSSLCIYVRIGVCVYAWMGMYVCGVYMLMHLYACVCVCECECVYA